MNESFHLPAVLRTMCLTGFLTPVAVLLPLLLLLCGSPLCHGASSHNIMDILAAHPQFTKFSAAVSSTGAATEIDSRSPITVLAIDNRVMAAQHLQPKELKRAISLNVLLDYYDDIKLGNIQFRFVRVTRREPLSGLRQHDGERWHRVNITKHRGGSVKITAPSSGIASAPSAAMIYQKTVQKTPYDIAVQQVSALISSPAAALQAPSPASLAAPAQAPATPAPASAPATALTMSPASATALAPTPATEPWTPAPAPAPVVAPVTAPTPRRRPAPEPESAPAPSPDANVADQKNNGARGRATWSLGATTVATALLVSLCCDLGLTQCMLA